MNYIWTKSKKIILVLVAMLLSVTLAACGPSTQDELEELQDALFLGSLSSVTNDINLPKTVKRGELVGEVTWVSNDTDVIEVTTHPTLETNFFLGKVTRPEAGEDDAVITLTATITLEGKTIDRDFEATVLAMPVAETFTVNEAKVSATKGQNVEIAEAVVVYVMSSGYFIGDETGNMYIFAGGTPTVVVGDRINIVGEKDIYYDMPQLKNATVTKLGTETVDLSTQAEVKELAEIMAFVNTNRSVYGDVFKVEGTLVANGGISSNALENPLTGDKLAIYNSSAGLDELAPLRTAGKYVEMLIIIQDYHSNGYWRVNYVPGTVVEKAAPQVTDETKVANAITKIESDFDNQNVFGEITLPTTDARYEGLTISWTSGTPAVLSNEGVVQEGLTEDTNVTMTVTVTLNEVTETVEVVLVAKAAEVATVAETLDAIAPAGDTAVWFSGVVLGFDKSGFFVGDETAAIYVRDTGKVADVEVGDEVEVKGTARIFYGVGKTSADATQFTYQVDASIVGFSATVKANGVADPMLDPVVKTVTELATGPFNVANAASSDFYGQYIEVTGKLEEIQVGNFTNLYITSGTDKVMIYYNSTSEALAMLNPLLNQDVTLKVMPIDLHFIDGWRLAFLGNEGDISVDLTEAEMLDIAEDEIRGIIDTDQVVRSDLNFIETTNLSAIIGNVIYGWNSATPGVLGHAGEYTAPETDTPVTITVYIFLPTNTGMTPNRTLEITVNVKPLPATSGVVISQIYGGGGNSGAPISHDFVELYNTTSAEIELDGWTLQYGSGPGDFDANDDNYTVTLSGTIPANGYYLIQLAAGANTALPGLPTPDVTGNIAVSSSRGTFALTNLKQTVNPATDLSNGEIVSDFIVDFVGWGTDPSNGAAYYLGSAAAPTTSNTLAVIRTNNQNTLDNAADFATGAPNPRNSASN